jgi:PadR family transcriptional regulator, regulatory protein PadR
MRQGSKPGTKLHQGKKAGDIRLSILEEDLLTLLNGKWLYGLQILEAMKDSGRAIAVGSLYPTLRSMEDKDLLNAEWGEERPEERGHARRRYYTASDEGQEALRHTKEQRKALEDWHPASKGAEQCPKDHSQASGYVF